ncbi:MAG: DNA N-6-adenine-methyltransferase [Glaciecola sp.]
MTNKANKNKLAYIGAKPGLAATAKRDSDSWFTPPEYIDSVRAVLGTIDLDPFSSQRANEIVGASHYFCVQNSAFDNDWNITPSAKIFMNPPYSAGLCGRSVNRFVDQYEAKHFSEGIVLANNATDTRWFSALVNHCTAICFTNHRISFWNADRKNVSGNTRGQAFFYFGKRKAKFKKVFEKHGFVMNPAK